MKANRPWEKLLSAFVGGWHDAFRMPLVLTVLWLINLLSAAFALSYLYRMLADYLERSGLHESAFSILQPVDVLEFMLAHKERSFVAILPFLLAGAGYMAFKMFMAGGILERLKNGPRCSWRHFLAACQRYFWKFVLISGLTGGFLLAIFAGFGYIVSRGISYLWDVASGPSLIFGANLGYGILLFLLVSVGARVYDYARIALVLAPQQRSFRTFWQAIRFTWRHQVVSFLLWLMFFILSFGVFAIFARLTAHLPADSMKAVRWQFLFGQIIVGLRIICRIAAFGAQMRFLKTVSAS
jgi:hypothetical protein